MEDRAIAIRRILDHVASGAPGPIPVQERDDPLAREVAATCERLRADRRELAAARDAADAANVAKSVFLANMSHELRTPLNAIIGYAELLAEDHTGDHPEEEADLAKILRSGRHLLRLISDILDLSKLDAGRVEVTPERIQVELLCEQVLDEVRPLAEANGNVVRLEVSREARTVSADRIRLRQVLENLLSNAAKFTRGGTVRLVVEGAIHADRPCVVFRVVDTGVGIAPEHLDAVFEPFVTGDLSSNGRRQGGTGLGLAISRRFARLMGGDLGVESEVGRGSTFSLRLPATVASGNQAATPLGVLRPCVLLVDDDPEIHDLVARYIDTISASLVSVYAADDANEVVRQVRPDVIVLDLLMGGQSGLDVLAELKSDPRTRGIPVVVQSVVDEAVPGQRLGAVEHLHKPVNRETFLGALRPWLGGQGGTILVVDDDEIGTTMCVRTLSANGWTVWTARDGREALDVLSARRPDIVLLDLLMPEIDGFALLARMDADPQLRDIRVVVHTAKALSRAERDVIGHTAGSILEKGAVSSHDLLRHLQRVYSERRLAPPLRAGTVGGGLGPA